MIYYIADTKTGNYHFGKLKEGNQLSTIHEITFYDNKQEFLDELEILGLEYEEEPNPDKL